MHIRSFIETKTTFKTNMSLKFCKTLILINGVLYESVNMAFISILLINGVLYESVNMAFISILLIHGVLYESVNMAFISILWGCNDMCFHIGLLIYSYIFEASRFYSDDFDIFEGINPDFQCLAHSYFP